MQNQPKTWWGAVLQFIKMFFLVATDATNVVETAVSMADDQVSALAERMEEDIAAENENYHDQVVHRAALVAAQSTQALTDFTTKNPQLAAFVKEEVDRLDGAVTRFRARKAARRQGSVPA